MTASDYCPAPRLLQLPRGLFDVVEPATFPELTLRFRNQRWAERVGLGRLSDGEWRAHFGRFEPLPDNLPEPLALRYHGHQFDVYNPALGDGRGFLFAQLADARGRLLDLGTKGSGQTPYSRGGDGRLTLKGGVREVLATEMLEALGVETSKSFSLFETGEALHRGDEPSPTRSSVLVRLSHSHVRFGTFQRLAFEGNEDAIAALVDYCCEHLIDVAATSPSERGLAFFREVVRRSAELCASWMVAGFVHGVLNSDNMVVTGESFDYGPYRFLPHYDPDFVAAYFDHGGLYAYARQPRAVLKNLERLAGTLTVGVDEEPLRRALATFLPAFRRARTEQVLQRLGLCPLEPDADALFEEAIWTFLAQSRVGFDRFFFDWYGGRLSVKRAAESSAAELYGHASFTAVAQGFETYEAREPDRLRLPYFSRAEPVSLVIDEVERVWDRISDHDDWTAFEAKIADARQLGQVYEP